MYKRTMETITSTAIMAQIHLITPFVRLSNNMRLLYYTA